MIEQFYYWLSKESRSGSNLSRWEYFVITVSYVGGIVVGLMIA